MRRLLITIAALVLVACGPSVPDDSIHLAASFGDIETVKQHLATGADVYGWGDEGGGATPLYWEALGGYKKNRRTANRKRCGCEFKERYGYKNRRWRCGGTNGSKNNE